MVILKTAKEKAQANIVYQRTTPLLNPKANVKTEKPAAVINRMSQTKFDIKLFEKILRIKRKTSYSPYTKAPSTNDHSRQWYSISIVTSIRIPPT
ncbi:MAG: hypothetical protein SOZ77_07010 [Candidatus Limousia pullorum]|nr:hypothetical protein [Candidatus Limousia pullorum]